MFSIHGQWKIEVNNNVVLQCFSGAWNEEAIITYIKNFRQKAIPLSKNSSMQGKWAILSIFENWELGIPAIEPHVKEHCQWFKDHGCIKDCHVYTPSYTKHMQLENMIPQTEGDYERRIFTRIAKAKSWLAQNGFIITDTPFLQGYTNI